MIKYYGIILEKIILLLLLSVFFINCASAEGRLANMGAEVFYQNFSKYTKIDPPMEISTLQYMSKFEQEIQIQKPFKGLYPYGFMVKDLYNSYNRAVVIVFTTATGYIDSITVLDRSDSYLANDKKLYMRCSIRAMQALGIPLHEIGKMAEDDFMGDISGQATTHIYSDALSKEVYWTIRYEEPLIVLIDYMPIEDRFAMP